MGSLESPHKKSFFLQFWPKLVLLTGRSSMGNLPGKTRLQFSPKTNHMESPKPLKPIPNSVWGLWNLRTKNHFFCNFNHFDQNCDPAMSAVLNISKLISWLKTLYPSITNAFSPIRPNLKLTLTLEAVNFFPISTAYFPRPLARLPGLRWPPSH